MENKKQLIEEAKKKLEYIQGMTRAQEDKLVRVYIHGLGHQIRYNDLFSTRTKEGVIKSWKNRQCRRLAKTLLKDMTDLGFLKARFDEDYEPVYSSDITALTTISLGYIYSLPPLTQDMFYSKVLKIINTQKKSRKTSKIHPDVIKALDTLIREDKLLRFSDLQNMLGYNPLFIQGLKKIG